MRRWLLLPVLLVVLAGCGGGGAEPSRKAAWIEDAFAAIRAGRYPRLKAVSWWHEAWDGVNLRIDSSPEALAAYRRAVQPDGLVTRPRFEDGRLVAPDSGVYLAAFPDFCGPEDCVSAGRIAEFEALAGKPLAWAYFSDNWFDAVTGEPRIRFPLEAVRAIDAAGRQPFIRLMARSSLDEGQADPVYSMQSIIDGDFDTALDAWADAARDWGRPLLIEFGTEVNGEWFPWNGIHNGGAERTGYGDPMLADGPERFRDAYRHVIDRFRARGADNITWFFHVNADSEPPEEWNRIQAYYPGDDYIDWIGVSVYNGSWVRDEDQDFVDILDETWMTLTGLSGSRPIAVLEMGMSD